MKKVGNASHDSSIWETPSLEGRVALITGAGRGIGRAIALEYAKAGAKLALISRTQSELSETAGQVRKVGAEVLEDLVDVSDYERIQSLVSLILDRFGRLDILVNNAGILGPVGPLAENDVKAWKEAISVNLLGVFNCCRNAVIPMQEQGSGKIINLLGGGATLPYPRFSAYAASKSGVAGLTQTLAEELREHNIQVNAIAPGLVNTRLQDEILAAGTKAGKRATERANDAKKGKAVSPNEAATLAVFLASDKSDGLTGRIISAAWDDWRSLSNASSMQELVLSEYYTLRRIDGVFFSPKKDGHLK